MSAIDHVRRVVTVLLVAATLFVVPQIASAEFTRSATSSLAVTTATLETPSALRGSYTCVEDKGRKIDAITVALTTFSGSWPTGTSYVVVITSGGEEYARGSGPLKTQVLTGTQPKEKGNTVWTVEVYSALGQWLSPAGSVDINCQKQNIGSF
ncbi:hypothetical protein I601_2801 [Nocardioides dokdonensis FR1436]|uniref:Uncharacterized protein n=1 Tax=Nocardioides dokdonensis FR1436 TaxID=1300347 RepID=A0A1A9GLL7_9ACTN|nr:hypothetical protein [Nocardioides dokdonensis]ANH39217.1 hypothetical protein I601_2801 [Nocardioides dokdonensis FR1436]